MSSKFNFHWVFKRSNNKQKVAKSCLNETLILTLCIKLTFCWLIEKGLVLLVEIEKEMERETSFSTC